MGRVGELQAHGGGSVDATVVLRRSRSWWSSGTRWPRCSSSCRPTGTRR
jgi:hypothetical protein